MIIRCSGNWVCTDIHIAHHSAPSLVERQRFGNKVLICHLPVLTSLLDVCTIISHTRFSFIAHCYCLLHRVTMLYTCHGTKQTVAITVTGRLQTIFFAGMTLQLRSSGWITHSRRYWTDFSLLNHFKNDVSPSSFWMTPRHTRVVVPNPISPIQINDNDNGIKKINRSAGQEDCSTALTGTGRSIFPISIFPLVQLQNILRRSVTKYVGSGYLSWSD